MTRLARKSKADYFKTGIEQARGDSKKMWGCLKKLFPKSKPSGVSSLEADGRLITSPSEIANQFNTFFVSVGEILAKKIIAPTRTALEFLNNTFPQTNCQFNFKLVTVEEVRRQLGRLDPNKATGMDNIQAKLLKVSAPAISDSLCFLLNFSITSGQVPQEWKRARVSAIHKKESKLDAGNYRPISVLPVISKLLEHIVHTQVYTYLTDNDLMSPEQSGFRKIHSTQTSLHRIMEHFYSKLQNGELVGMIALDLRKAFDTVDHHVLLDKLKFYGINGVPLQWFRSYLQDRSQVVGVNGSLSDPLSVTTGVPQGSILGPLLFILYMNDLPGCLTKCDSNMYADDTAFYTSAPSKETVMQRLQADLLLVDEWLRANKLSLHIGKTVCMLITSRQRRRHISSDLSLRINDTRIQQVESSPYLGVTLDQNLTFHFHIENTIKKASRSLGALKRASYLIPQNTCITMYNALVLPHLDYCVTVWASVGDTQIQRIQKIQNRGMRIILQCGPRTHIHDMLSKLKWLSVKQRIRFMTCVLVYKIRNSLTPNYLTDTISTISHHYPTRARMAENLYVSRAHPRSLTTLGTKYWNELPPSIRTLPTLHAFKKACAEHIACTTDIY